MSVILNDLKRSIAFVCPACFKLCEQEVNIFGLSSGLSLACGSECVPDSVTAVRSGDKLRFTVECPVCCDVHTFYISLHGAVQKELISFACPEHGAAEILFFGRPDLVHEKAAALDLDSYIEKLEDDLFIGCIIDERLDFLSGSGGLQCLCGSTDIEIESDYDSFSLFCPACGNQIDLTYSFETLEALSRDTFVF